MRPIRHVFNGVLRIGKFVLIYVLSILLLSCFFALIYKKQNISNPIQLSIDVLWGEPAYPQNVSGTAKTQKIVYEVFLVFLVGNYISQQLKPLNPIEHSKFIACNEIENHYSFRYWVLLPKRKYLFNVKARLLVTDQAELNRGDNRLSSQYEKEETYNSIRGVRTFTIKGEDAESFASVLQRGSVISLYIIGTSESGITYSSVKRYKPTDIMRGYGFVSIRRSAYEKQALPVKSKRKHKNCKEFIRYQHFDKLYQLSEKQGKQISEKPRHVLSKEEILFGQYHGIWQCIIDFTSWLSTLVLGK